MSKFGSVISFCFRLIVMTLCKWMYVFYVKTNCMHHTHTTDEISSFLIVIILIIECRQCRFMLHVGTSLNFICRSKHFLEFIATFIYLPLCNCIMHLKSKTEWYLILGGKKFKNITVFFQTYSRWFDPISHNIQIALYHF